MATTDLLSQLKRHEGLRLWVYRCPTGHRTIGYGHNLDATPLSKEERKPAQLAERPSRSDS